MGFSAVAAHMIVLIALASAGTLLVGAFTESVSGQLEAQSLAFDRLRDAEASAFSLASSNYTAADRTYANFTNDGSTEVPLDEVTLLVDGTWTAHASVATFEIREEPTSNLWMPGETLEIMTQGRGDADLSIVGPHGTASHRRA